MRRVRGRGLNVEESPLLLLLYLHKQCLVKVHLGIGFPRRESVLLAEVGSLFSHKRVSPFPLSL